MQVRGAKSGRGHWQRQASMLSWRSRLGRPQPLGSEELSEFEETMLSPLTEATRKSHRGTNVKYLRREFSSECAGLSAHQVLLRHHSVAGLQRVAAALASARTSNAANYLSTWTSYVAATGDIPQVVERHRRKLMRALWKVAGPETQAL